MSTDRDTILDMTATKLNPVVRELLSEVDFRLVAATLLSLAANILGGALAAKIITPINIQSFFTGGLQVALEATDHIPKVMITDGENTGLRQ